MQIADMYKVRMNDSIIAKDWGVYPLKICKKHEQGGKGTHARSNKGRLSLDIGQGSHGAMRAKKQR